GRRCCNPHRPHRHGCRRSGGGRGRAGTGHAAVSRLRAEAAPARPARSGGQPVTFRASVLTLYPEMFPGALGQSLAGRALEAGTWSLDVPRIRDFAADRHRTVDDTPAGGGAGMVMRADVLASAIDHVSPSDDPRPRLLMSPRGRPLTQAKVGELAT